MTGKIVLGLDPGTVRTGFALINISEQRNQPKLLDFGVLSAPARMSLEQRLSVIGQAVEKIYKKYSISETAIEQIFFGKNPNSAFKLGQVFGICVYQATCSGSEVFSYAARYVKKSITGSGNADKQAVQAFVLSIFGVKQTDILEDATDALAVALCHFYQKQALNLQSPKSNVQIRIGSTK